MDRGATGRSESNRMVAEQLAVVMTVFNRRTQTLACLRSLEANLRRLPTIEATVFLTDDGSTDGTAQAVQAEFPRCRILPGSGSLFWNGGMRLAMAEAMRVSPQHYLWLNDDVTLVETALETLFETARRSTASGPESIVVGSTRDEVHGATNYGGRIRRHRWRPLLFSLVEPGTTPVECETINANCVLLPASAVDAVGNLDAAFVHGMGDFDYGLRAGRAGLHILVAPGHVGTCGRPSLRGEEAAAFTSARAAWRSVTGPKALPLVSWRTFTRRYAGPAWIAYWLKPYARALVIGFMRGGI